MIVRSGIWILVPLLRVNCHRVLDDGAGFLFVYLDGWDNVKASLTKQGKVPYRDLTLHACVSCV